MHSNLFIRSSNIGNCIFKENTDSEENKIYSENYDVNIIEKRYLPIYLLLIKKLLS